MELTDWDPLLDEIASSIVLRDTSKHDYIFEQLKQIIESCLFNVVKVGKVRR
jgi:hypothetical protein